MVSVVRPTRALRLGPRLCSRRHDLKGSFRWRPVFTHAKEDSSKEDAPQQQDAAAENAEVGEAVSEKESEVESGELNVADRGPLEDFNTNEVDLEYDDHLPVDYDPDAEGDDDELYRDAVAWDDGWEEFEEIGDEGEKMQTTKAPGEWDDKVVQVHFRSM
jgi:hypothetical protein